MSIVRDYRWMTVEEAAERLRMDLTPTLWFAAIAGARCKGYGPACYIRVDGVEKMEWLLTKRGPITGIPGGEPSKLAREMGISDYTLMRAAAQNWVKTTVSPDSLTFVVESVMENIDFLRAKDGERAEAVAAV